LFVQQAIEVVGDHCQTVSYAYRFQTADDVWLLRWEFPESARGPTTPLRWRISTSTLRSSSRRRRRRSSAWTRRPRICTFRRRACRSSSYSGT
jgi:hypothetical protein